MKTKLEMAHEWIMKHDDGFMSVEVVVFKAWQYADAMQAEADKREKEEIDKQSAELRNILNLSKFKPLELQPDLKEWQPDWSQAPEWANWWAMDMDKNCYWYEDKLHLGDVEWDRHSIGKSFKSKHYGYTGDWRNSLRKRPK